MKTLIQTLFFFLLVTQICFAQWYQQNSPTTQNLNAVTFNDSNNGFAVGDSGIIVHTTDGGLNWDFQASGIDYPLLGVSFMNTSVGTVVGESGTILRTTDAGTHWIQQTSGISYYNILTDIYFINEDTGWVVGHAFNNDYGGIILTTTDGGNNWSILLELFGTQYLFNSVTFLDSDNGFIVGGEQVSGSIVKSNPVWEGGSILKTTNGGLNWTSYQTTHLRDISQINLTNGIAVGYGNSGLVHVGRFVYTIDGWQTWTETEIDSFFDGVLNCVYFSDSNHGLIAGERGWPGEGVVFYTSDGCLNWSEQVTFAGGINSMFFLNSAIGWAVGASGTILHTTNGGVSFVEEELIDEIPNIYSLSNNFPNPFNPSTKIKYSVPQSSTVIIKVFDVLGNEIETLVNEEKPASTYEVNWYAEELTSGVYFYQLRAGDFIQTKKMLLLK